MSGGVDLSPAAIKALATSLDTMGDDSTSWDEEVLLVCAAGTLRALLARAEGPENAARDAVVEAARDWMLARSEHRAARPGHEAAAAWGKLVVAETRLVSLLSVPPLAQGPQP